MSWVEEDDTRDRMSVALLTGFLGSGKTTLLNRILKDLSDRGFISIESKSITIINRELPPSL